MALSRSSIRRAGHAWISIGQAGAFECERCGATMTRDRFGNVVGYVDEKRDCSGAEKSAAVRHDVTAGVKR